MTGEHSILIAKSILDLFTALIFACTLGGVVSLIAIPQLVMPVSWMWVEWIMPFVG